MENLEINSRKSYNKIKVQNDGFGYGATSGMELDSKILYKGSGSGGGCCCCCCCCCCCSSGTADLKNNF